MTTTAPAHFVFVDFENVPKVDLGLAAGKPVHVTLLIGKNQGKLDFGLVEQIHRQAAQLELVKLDASGRNALDLTLAFCLGRAIERTPEAHFWIISKDRDFEPMIAHLVAKQFKVARCDNFAALPFFPKPKKIAAKTAAPIKANAPVKPVPLNMTVPEEERLGKLIVRLKNNLDQRPKKRDRLLAYINTAFGGKLTESEQIHRLDELIRQGVLAIATSGKVTYL